MASLSSISISRKTLNDQALDLFKQARSRTLGNPNNPNSQLMNQLLQQQSLIDAQKNLTLNNFQVSLADLRQQVFNAQQQNKELQAQTGLTDAISRLRDSNALANQVDYQIGKLLNQSQTEALNIATQQQANFESQVQASFGALIELQAKDLVNKGEVKVDHLKQAGDFFSGALTGIGLGLPLFGVAKGLVGAGLRSAGSRFNLGWATKAGEVTRNLGAFRYGSAGAKQAFNSSLSALKSAGQESINVAKGLSGATKGLGKAGKLARASTLASGAGRVGVGFFSGWAPWVALAGGLIGGLASVLKPNNTPYYISNDTLEKLKSSDTWKSLADVGGFSVDDFGNSIADYFKENRF